jgi:hypothetical protein
MCHTLLEQMDTHSRSRFISRPLKQKRGGFNKFVVVVVVVVVVNVCE